MKSGENGLIGPGDNDYGRKSIPDEVKVTRKPIKAKPMFYSVCLIPLQVMAREMGYNLLIHGSMDRDMDLVAVPWVDEPKPQLELIQEFDMFLNGVRRTHEASYMYNVLPGGRHSYVINLNRGGEWNKYIDEQFYIDISITPLVKR